MNSRPAPAWYQVSWGIGLGLVCLVLAMEPARADSGKEKPLGKGVRSVAFSSDGTLVAATLGEPEERGRIVLWEVAGQKQLWSHEEKKGIPALAFAPDGKTLAIGSYDNVARLLDPRTGRMLKELAGHTSYVRALAFSSDGKTLATGSWDHTIKLWDPASGTLRQTLDFPDRYALYQVSFSPSGKWLLASAQTTRIWDTATGKEIRTVNGEHAVFVDEQWLVTTGETGRARNVSTGEQSLLFRNLGSKLAYSSRARRLAAGGYLDIYLLEFPVKKLDTKDREHFASLLVKLDDDDYAVREATGKQVLAMGLAIEPDLRRQMKESPSVEVRIRCRRLREELLKKPSLILSGHTGQVEGLAFSPDGRLLASGSKDGTVRLWNVPEGKEIARLIPR